MLLGIWLLVGTALGAVTMWALGRRGKSGPSSPPWVRIVVMLGSFGLSGVLMWWLFDAPGLFELQRRVAAGDYVGAANAHHPLVVFDGRVIVPLFAVGIVGLGVHMAFRPAYWVRLARIGQSDSAQDSRLVARFRVYGIVVVVLGLVAVLGLAATLLWA
ncbi:MAG: hypothetical protein Q7V53_03400 [Caldisericota bacterium]|nr:hypothetical protein [Caldisericota bacterium]